VPIVEERHMIRSTHLPSRRRFLGALGTGLAATMTGPTLLGASD
jgi:hypothetical protein